MRGQKTCAGAFAAALVTSLRILNTWRIWDLIAWAIIDTGPLVAYLNRDEAQHPWATKQFELADEPFVTCEAVLCEALFILRRDRVGHRRLFELLDRDLVRVRFEITRHANAVSGLMTQYVDLPMSLADACLVRMAEENPGIAVVTMDKHFGLYRTSDRRVIKLIMPKEKR